MKVLVVDDMQSMRQVTCHLLKSLGYTDVFQAEDGKSALKILDNQPIDLVISDWNMPVMSGLDLLKHIRRHESHSGTPVIMITGEASKAQILDAARAGVNSYIVKPFSGNVLREKIDMVINAFKATA